MPAVSVWPNDLRATRGIGKQINEQLLEHEEVGSLRSSGIGAILLVT